MLRKLKNLVWLYRFLLWMPDFVLRLGMRYELRERLSFEEVRRKKDPKWDEKFCAMMDRSEIAPCPDAAKAQHYEVPAQFYEYVLGARLKYSSALWDGGGEGSLAAVESPSELADRLSEAEERMLGVVVRRAGLEDGMEVLDLGGGWGSLAFYVLEKFEKIKMTSLSNSHSQRIFLEERSQALGVEHRLSAITANVGSFTSEQRFDRILSIEMFEHMRNHRALLQKIKGFLAGEDGKIFIHVFAHRKYQYCFNDEDLGNWMSRTFFSEGMMPRVGSFKDFGEILQVEASWVVSGKHYAKTAEAWLARHERFRPEIEALFLKESIGGRGPLGELAPSLRWMAWKAFFMACAELFGMEGGEQWCVAHYLLGSLSQEL